MARSSMIHRAFVIENTASGTDPDGHPIPPVWEAEVDADEIACRAYTKARKEIIDGDKTAMIEDLKALFPLTASITESKRISNIKDRLGAVSFAGPLDILTIQRRGNHLEASLDRIQS